MSIRAALVLPDRETVRTGTGTIRNFGFGLDKNGIYLPLTAAVVNEQRRSLDK
jgi:hypothetical protein